MSGLHKVDQLLGPLRKGHPAAEVLCAFEAGEVEASGRAAIAAHLESCELCRLLCIAARAGLDEAERVERELAPPSLLHRVIGLPPAPPALAFAASQGAAVPLPEDRRVLAEEHGRFRIVYFREGARGQLGIFSERPGALERLSCTLEDRPLQPASAEERLIVDLGDATRLPGCTLRIVFEMDGTPHGYSFTLVEE